MIQLINVDLQYTYNCVNPCGEDDIIVEVKNDFRSQDANIGLSVSSNMLQFIKEDADEVRYLIDTGYDYKVNLNNLALYQLDLMNYEDDGIIVKVPIISSSLKDFLQNTTLEALQIAKSDICSVRKRPYLTFEDAYESRFVGRNNLVYNLFDARKDTISGIANAEEDYVISIPVGIGDNYVSATQPLTITEKIVLTPQPRIVYPAQVRMVAKGYIYRKYTDDTEDFTLMQTHNGTYQPTAIGSGSPPSGDAIVVNFSESYSFTTYYAIPSSFNSKTVIEARYVIAMQIEFTNVPYLYAIEYQLLGSLKFNYEQAVIYDLPAISMTTINQVLGSKGISIPIISGNYYITSANVDKLRSTRLLDIVTFFARMKGAVLDFSTMNVCAGHDLFYWGFVNLGNTYCNWQKKGFPQCFSQKIGQNPSKLRLSNTPESMWQNTYTTEHNSQLLKEDSITSPIISDGAEILNVLISNSQEVFIVDNMNSELTSDDDLPINYSFSAVCVAYNNRERIFSNAPVMMNEFTPADTSGVVFTIPNHIAGLTTLSTISYKGQPRLSPYTIEMDVPMTQALIAQILSQGYLVGVTIDGTDYYVEECSFKLAPNQCHLSLREVISTPL